jgi:hypothetical protein
MTCKSVKTLQMRTLHWDSIFTLPGTPLHAPESFALRKVMVRSQASFAAASS